MRIDGAEDVVKELDVAVLVDDAGELNALLLAAAEVDPALADLHMVVVSATSNSTIGGGAEAVGLVVEPVNVGVGGGLKEGEHQPLLCFVVSRLQIKMDDHAGGCIWMN